MVIFFLLTTILYFFLLQPPADRPSGHCGSESMCGSPATVWRRRMNSRCESSPACNGGRGWRPLDPSMSDASSNAAAKQASRSQPKAKEQNRMTWSRRQQTTSRRYPEKSPGYCDGVARRSARSLRDVLRQARRKLNANHLDSTHVLPGASPTDPIRAGHLDGWAQM